MTMKSENSENLLIIGIGACLMTITILSFFRVPAYEKAVWYLAGVFATAFTAIMGYKFGRSMPQQSTDAKPGQSSQVDSKIITEPPAAPPAV